MKRRPAGEKPLDIFDRFIPDTSVRYRWAPSEDGLIAFVIDGQAEGRVMATTTDHGDAATIVLALNAEDGHRRLADAIVRLEALRMGVTK